MNNSSLPGSYACDIERNAHSVSDSVIFLTISSASILGNIMVFVCYANFRYLRTVTNVFMISLAASDLLVALLSIPFSFLLFVCQNGTFVKNQRLNNFIYFVADMLPSVLSIYSLMLVAIDRAIAINKPYFHQENVTKNGAWLTVAIMWLLIMIFVALKLVFDYYNDSFVYTIVAIVAAYAIPVSVMAVSYGLIGFIARKHAVDLRKLDKITSRLQSSDHTLNSQNSVVIPAKLSSTKVPSAKLLPAKLSRANLSPKNLSPTNLSPTKLSPTNLSPTKLLSPTNLSPTNPVLLPTRDILSKNVMGKPKLPIRELKAAFTISVILCCFIICWTPFIALNIEYIKCAKGCNISKILIKYFKMLHYSSSALNPLLFILLNKRWRRAFKKIISYCHTQNKYHSSVEMSCTDLTGW